MVVDGVEAMPEADLGVLLAEQVRPADRADEQQAAAEHDRRVVAAASRRKPGRATAGIVARSAQRLPERRGRSGRHVISFRDVVPNQASGRRPDLTDPIIAVVLGTRPEAVKLAPVICALRRADVRTAVFSTGQHRDMVTEVLDQFEIRVDEDLELMQAGQSLDHVLTRTIVGIGELLDRQRPRAVLVQGDTSSALGSSLAAFHRTIPVGHVEAGLRSGDLSRPFPEEMNRRAISVMARWHFAPTGTASDNLAAEGIRHGVHIVGNTVVDALRFVIADTRELPETLAPFPSGRFILATAHRRESWDTGIGEIATGLSAVLAELPDMSLVFVTHPNPIARAPVDAEFKDHPRVIVTGHLPYRVFLELLRRCDLAVSDSGGVQEEGPSLGVPVIVTRAVTERPEGVLAGAVRVVGTVADQIRDSAIEILENPEVAMAMRQAGAGIYGDGAAAGRIATVLRADLGLSS